MKRNPSIDRTIVFAASMMAALMTPGSAQDSHFVPYAPTDQLLKSPPCLTLRGAWEGGNLPCTPFAHREWLADLTHWRAERRIRIGYDRRALRPSRAAVGAIELHAAADDGAGPLFLRSGRKANTRSTVISTTSRSAMAESTRA